MSSYTATEIASSKIGNWANVPAMDKIHLYVSKKNGNFTARIAVPHAANCKFVEDGAPTLSGTVWTLKVKKVVSTDPSELSLLVTNPSIAIGAGTTIKASITGGDSQTVMTADADDEGVTNFNTDTPIGAPLAVAGGYKLIGFISDLTTEDVTAQAPVGTNVDLQVRTVPTTAYTYRFISSSAIIDPSPNPDPFTLKVLPVTGNGRRYVVQI